MTTGTPDQEPAAHLVIAGTGRAGTSFLVRYLTELGLDTHVGRHGQQDSWDEDANAGLETVPLPDQGWDLPYVVKYPWLYQCIDHILAGNIMRLDGVIIPVRDLGEASISRTLVELQAMYRSLPWMAELDQSWEVWGRTPGGLTYSLNPLDQARLLAVGFHHLVERLLRADIPIVLVAFPRLVQDPRYLFRKLRPLLPVAVSEDAASEAHSRVADLTKVRVGGELEATMRSDVPPHDLVTHHPSRDRLDAIAIRRELTRMRRLTADAEAAAQRANAEAATARAEAAEANARATEAQLEAAAANARAAAASLEASGCREEAGKSREAATRAKGEANALREALAHAGQALNAENERCHREIERRLSEIQHRDREVEQRDHEVARLRAQVIVAQTEAERLRRDLAVVYASRSWRLGRPYRAFGGVLQRLRPGGRPAPGEVHLLDQSPAPEPVPEAPAEDQPRAQADPSSRWPIWLDDNTFVTQRFTYTMSKDQFEGLTESGTVALLKDRKFVELYRDFISELRPQRILEIGFFQGGMPLFLADIAAPEKVVGVDYLHPSEALKSMIAGAGLQNSVKLHGGIMQGDTSTLRQLVDGEFADRPLDLIIDDASHEYENSKACFQELFGYLRPGGKYVIEDWGWLHWPGEAWQTAKSHFWNKPAMTNLIFELVMTLGSHHPKIISRIDVLSWACVVATRGEGLAHGEPIDLSATRLTAGRRFQPL